MADTLDFRNEKTSVAPILSYRGLRFDRSKSYFPAASCSSSPWRAASGPSLPRYLLPTSTASALRPSFGIFTLFRAAVRNTIRFPVPVVRVPRVCARHVQRCLASRRAPRRGSDRTACAVLLSIRRLLSAGRSGRRACRSGAGARGVPISRWRIRRAVLTCTCTRKTMIYSGDGPKDAQDHSPVDRSAKQCLPCSGT